MNDNLFLVILPIVAAGFYVLGVLIGTSMMHPAECHQCEECVETNCYMQEAQLMDQRSLFTKQLEEKQEEYEELHELGTNLWDDYWYCNISYECIGDEQRCFKDYNMTKEELGYYNSKCWYAENYDKYFNEFWEEFE